MAWRREPAPHFGVVAGRTTEGSMTSKPASKPAKPTHLVNPKPTPREARVLAMLAKPKGGKR